LLGSLREFKTFLLDRLLGLWLFRVAHRVLTSRNFNLCSKVQFWNCESDEQLIKPCQSARRFAFAVLAGLRAMPFRGRDVLPAHPWVGFDFPKIRVVSRKRKGLGRFLAHPPLSGGGAAAGPGLSAQCVSCFSTKMPRELSPFANGLGEHEIRRLPNRGQAI